MRSRRNLLLILLVVILILAVVYFVRQRRDSQVAIEETPVAEVTETNGETPTDSGNTVDTPEETTTGSDSEPADANTATDEPTTDESPTETEVSDQPADTTEQTEPTEAVEDSSTEGSTADTETTEGETADTTEETTTDSDSETAATGTTTEETAATTTTGATITYVVRPGDNLFLIGLPYGLQWTEIAAVNDLDDPNDLTVGQEILIPAGSVVTPRPPTGPSGPTTHRVHVGENLFRIALRYNMDYITLGHVNNIGYPYTIYVGQSLTIPGR
jgi:LysM repeat protein